MAWQLVLEVLHHAPKDLTPAERMVMVVIAESVHQQDYRKGLRGTYRTHEEIADLAGLTDAGVRKVLYRLANPPAAHADRSPIELRVALGKDKNGRPLWAVTGRKPEFRVPLFEPPDGCRCRPCRGRNLGPGSEVAEESDGETSDCGPEPWDCGPESSDCGPNDVGPRSRPTGVPG